MATGPGNPLSLKLVTVGMPDLTAPLDTGPWTIEAKRGEQATQLPIEVVPGLPSVGLTVSPAVIDESTEELALKLLARDFRGAALTGRDFRVLVPQATSLSKVTDAGDGKYEATLALGDAENVIMGAHADFPVASLPPASLVLWPASSQVLSGQSAPLFAVALDAMYLFRLKKDASS